MKKPRPGGGVLGSGWARALSRASILRPREGSVFRAYGDAKNREHGAMMVGWGGFVNERRITGERVQCGISLAAKEGAAALNSARKKAGPKSPA